MYSQLTRNIPVEMAMRVDTALMPAQKSMTLVVASFLSVDGSAEANISYTRASSIGPNSVVAASMLALIPSQVPSFKRSYHK